MHILDSSGTAQGLAGSKILWGSPVVVLEMTVLFIKSLVVSESCDCGIEICLVSVKCCSSHGLGQMYACALVYKCYEQERDVSKPCRLNEALHIKWTCSQIAFDMPNRQTDKFFLCRG